MCPQPKRAIPANDTGIDRTEKRFLILFLILLCLDAVLTRLYPNEFGPLLSTSFVVLAVIPLLIITRWAAEKLSGVGSSIAGVFYVLLLLFLLGAMIKEQVPSIKRHIGLWEVLSVTLVCLAISVGFIVLKRSHDLHPLGSNYLSPHLYAWSP
ncbi:MAG: hypothetical protein WB799_19495 [Candidatus Sulfotelmatobacter sp.]